MLSGMHTQAEAAVVDLHGARTSCATCGLHELCLPSGMNADVLARLDGAMRQKRVLGRGSVLYRQGDAARALYVVKAGSVKTYVDSADGDAQVLGFHLASESLGADALAGDVHSCTAEALESTTVCELSYARLEDMAQEAPALRRKLASVLGSEVRSAQDHLVMMGKPQAIKRLALFLHGLSDRHGRLSRDSAELKLTMSRQDIASYLGLVIETVSRLFTRMEEDGVLEVRRKTVRIVRPDRLADLCGVALIPETAPRRQAH
ncbi:CRP/FNR family transcriptional regulator [Luteibacter sp. Sphag1AF]|uniref:cyclic nucleotide-binding domain-containing protein n=1 Tax=Luteibacter sp. Sphag1AF TaxID=2587031 RepID=UPI0018550516|nr:cyclic nucleotide-binding domain-containing protein [Luteibacter sp. Sphag1AF]MBB3227638.1 CRP/FNR family transcriptional regulator [Luteibacter sp. Sphag1AF]